MHKISSAGFLLCFACLRALAQQVGFADLTVPPKTPEPVVGTVRVSGGGGLYDYRGPAPGTPKISVRLVRLTTYSEGKATRNAVEVEVTNRGDREMSVPIGADPNSSLAPGEPGRQYLQFTVMVGNDRQAVIARGRAATNQAHPAESVVLHTGESVVYRLPFSGVGSGFERGKSAAAENPELKAAVALWRIVVRDGEDWNERVGDEITSENSLWQR